MFESNVSCDDKKDGEKAVADKAVEGLSGLVHEHMSKPVASIEDVMGGRFDAAVNGWIETIPRGDCRGPHLWDIFWQQKPRVVGIDVEGNLASPPLLVQVATQERVWLEAPCFTGGLSEDLKRLLADETILKIFCEGSSCADRRSLGLPADVSSRRDIVDLEDVAAKLAGPTKVRRGLAKILGLALPQCPWRIGKEKPSKGQPSSSVKYFTAIEQGRQPVPRAWHQIPPHVKRYAAMDAWCTLKAWEWLMIEQAREQALNPEQEINKVQEVPVYGFARNANPFPPFMVGYCEAIG